ncbi:Rv1733c family protein [Geodermatophilus sp. SYSU D00815]
MSTSGVPARTLRRRFTLGSGPLKRASDRVEFLSRVVLVLALLAALPAGLVVGGRASATMHAVAAEQAAERHRVSATLLSDAEADDGPATPDVPTAATWLGPDGTARSGDVDAPAGARSGTTVDVWVDDAGALTDDPLTSAEATGQGIVLGVLTALGTVLAALSGHLLVVWLLERRRLRRWERGWASVEPLWVSRFR